MKSKATFLLSFLLISGLALGQGGPRISVKGGVNYTLMNNKNWASDGGVNTVPGIAPMAGLVLGYNMKAYNFGFTLGGFWKQYRQINETDISLGLVNVTNSSDIRLTYIEVPLLFRLRPAGNKMTREITYGGPYFEIGGAVSFLSNARSKNETSLPIIGSVKTTTDISGSYENTMFSGVIGFGFHQIGLENFAVTHGFRFTYGFSDIISSTGGKNTDYLATDGTSKSYEPTSLMSIGYVLTFSYKWSSWH